MDAQAVFQYLADHKDQKDVINKLLVIMKDLDPLSNSVKGMEQQPSIPIPHSANSAQVQMIANETSRLPNRSNPHSLKSAPHQY